MYIVICFNSTKADKTIISFLFLNCYCRFYPFSMCICPVPRNKVRPTTLLLNGFVVRPCPSIKDFLLVIKLIEKKN